ncbi:hypothetical protein D1872_290020 [compost metagenome]
MFAEQPNPANADLGSPPNIVNGMVTDDHGLLTRGPEPVKGNAVNPFIRLLDAEIPGNDNFVKMSPQRKAVDFSMLQMAEAIGDDPQLQAERFARLKRFFRMIHNPRVGHIIPVVVSL